jgi:CIC family chloride channel protein
MMSAPVSIGVDMDLHAALETMLNGGVRELLVVDGQGKILGFLDESEITQVYHAATAHPPPSS